MRLPAVQTADPERAIRELRAVSARLRAELAEPRPEPGPLPTCPAFTPTPTGQRCATCRVHRSAHSPETR